MHRPPVECSPHLPPVPLGGPFLFQFGVSASVLVGRLSLSWPICLCARLLERVARRGEGGCISTLSEPLGEAERFRHKAEIVVAKLVSSLGTSREGAPAASAAHGSSGGRPRTLKLSILAPC